MTFRLTALLFVALAAPAHAAPTAEEGYEGRALPDALKSLIWSKACDVVNRRPIETCTPETCTFTDARGDRFEPESPAWLPLFGYEWNIGANALNPGLVEGKALSNADLQGGRHRVALSLVSGLPVDLDPGDDLLQINPAFVRWVGRELLPEADTPMCGRTAQDLYTAAFQPAVRTALSIYADLKARGLFRKAGVDRMGEISMAYGSQKGPEASACKALGKGGSEDGKWARIAVCWWWLRRSAEGSHEAFAVLGRDVLARFDPKGLAKVSRSLPKAALPKNVNK
jgi:hypothetical protein